MKGGKDEGRFGGDADKIMGPMFPRLHVNDKEKGGPRAPPRNKMALYEQLSIPAQRFNSALPLAPHITSTLVPSASLSEGGGHERSVFSTFYIPPAPAYSTEKVNSRSSDGMDLNAGLVQFDRKSMKNAGYKMSNIASHLSSTAECSPVRPLEMSNSKDSCRKKLGDDDDFRVPTYANSGIAQSPKDHCGTNSTFTCISSVQLQNAHNRPMKEPNTVDLKSRRSMHHDVENEKNQSEQKPKSTVEIKDGVEKHSCHLVGGEKTVEPSKCVKKILNQEHLSGPTSGCEDLDTESSRFYQESREDNNCGNGVSIDPSRPDEVEIREDGNVSMVRSGTSSRASLGNSNEGLNRAESGDKACSLVQVGDGGKYDDVSETSMLDSMSALDISPDDVVEAIGQKHFWKARRAIVNQQRVFAVQVFELHRLIKVQKLIAGSPHLLLEGNLYSTKPSPKVSSAKKFPSEFVMKAPLQIVKQKPELQNPDPSPSLGNGINEGPVSHISSHGPYSENPSPVPVPADNKAAPWCFHPPGNQWLVPVMSPSEGLIYKPYTGPCPPIASFMAPVYGGCGPLSLPPVPGDVTNPPYGVLASHQQGVAVLSGVPTVPQSYFPLPFGLPVVNPIISGTMQAAALPAERGNPAAGIRSNGQVEQFPTGEINVSMHSGSSCNTSNQKSEAFSCQLQKFGSSKDCEFQGGMPSSARKKVTGEAKQALEGRDVLPLFPMDPTVEALDWQLALGGSEHPGRVIKVVPHNPSSATESAARIFRSIQKERQQF